MKFKIELGPDEIKKIIRDYLEQSMRKKVTFISIEVGTTYQGYGQGEIAVPSFKNITAELEDLKPSGIPPEFDPPSLR